MLITKAPDKMETLAGAASDDICAYNGPGHKLHAQNRFIFSAALPGGGCVNLLKVLMTNVCINDCGYCVNQSGRDCPRYTFQPDELAKTFSEMSRKKLVSGLFLSSGIAGNPSRTMQSMIEAVQIVRKRYAFKGYVHLKILPGASFDCVEQACRIATRVSVNMEAPTARHLSKLSARKDIHEGILERMQWVKQLILKDPELTPAGQTTQFVVGAAGETDRDLLKASHSLYQDLGLKRAYYSPFHPISHSRLENVPPAPEMREHRLYQADWLLRIYGYSLPDMDLALGKSGNLDLSKDPKLTIARAQPWLFPVDVNKADFKDLIRVPGIGPISARKILEARLTSRINSFEQLRKMRVLVKQAAPYVHFNGMLDWEKQLTFLPEPEQD